MAWPCLAWLCPAMQCTELRAKPNRSKGQPGRGDSSGLSFFRLSMYPTSVTYVATRRRIERPRSAVRQSPLGGILGGFPSEVEAWRPLVEKYAGDLPPDFLLAWIERESDGNPCSWTTLRESGVFQLMYGDNLIAAGVTEPQLRAACVPNTQQIARTLTDEEAEIQITSGIRYVNWARNLARQKLAAGGVSWPESEPSFWAAVKMIHAYPSLLSPSRFAAATAQLGHPPRDWGEFRSTITGFESVLNNAEAVGLKANPSASALLGGGIFPVLLLGGLGALYLLSR